MRRVYAVWRVLARGGLPVERMRLKAHGDSGAMYLRGDRGGYSFDRRVLISIFAYPHSCECDPDSEEARMHADEPEQLDLFYSPS